MLSMTTRIRRARVAAKLSQSQLASLVGIRRSAVAQWECAGAPLPSLENLAKTAIATGVLFEWLATGRGKSQPEDNEFDLAVSMQDYAQNAEEARMLELFRRLPSKKRQAACSIVEILSC